MSVYSDSAARYLENGLSVIPCAAGAKFPGTHSQAHGWHAAYDWQKYGKERRPTGFETKIWDGWPDAGICLALGGVSGKGDLHLVAIDIDTDEPAEAAAIRSVLPGSPCAKRGAKGETQFYQASLNVKSRPYNDANGRRLLDLLCEGRQTVMPPSMHPDCPHCGVKGSVMGEACTECGAVGQSYRWITPDALDDFDVADLPILPDNIAEQLAKALEPFGCEPEPLRVSAGNATLEGVSIHRELNDAALANLGAWVPQLGLYKCRQVGANYKAVASWRSSSSGRPMSARATNLIISPDGIRDKGAERGYTPIDLVMAACECDLDVAFAWLQERVAPAPIIKLSAKVPGNLSALNFRPTTDQSNNLGPVAEQQGDGADIQSHIEPDDSYIIEYQPTPIIPAEICTPPGLIGEIVDWMNACSPVPSPQLNLSVTLAFLGALYGRRFEAPTGARSNLYCIGVADSGFGKSFPIKCVNAIDRAAKLERFIGPGGLKSDSALRKLLERQNPVFMQMDEVGELFGRILNRRAGSHEIGLRELLLALFSSADDVYRGSEGAAEKATPIYNPHFNLHGFSTPSAFWSAFSTANAENGLLPRILIFDAGAREPDEVKPSASRDDVPQAIVKSIHRTLDVRPAGNLAGALVAGPVKPIHAEYGPGAEAVYVAMREEMKERRRATDGLAKLAYSRFAEHAIKLALIYAVGCSPEQPEITVAGLAWARQVVECTTLALLEGALDRVADSEFQADYKKVLRIIRGGGVSGLTMDVMTRAIAGSIEKRRLADIVDQLCAAREIEKFIGSGPKGGRPAQRLRVMAGDDGDE